MSSTASGPDGGAAHLAIGLNTVAVVEEPTGGAKRAMARL